MALQEPMMPSIGTASSSFLPLNKPIVEPRPRPRAIKQEPLDDAARHRFTPAQLQKLLYHLPSSLLKRQKSTTTTSTTTPSSTTSTTTTTKAPKRNPPPAPKPMAMKFMSKPNYQRQVATFHWSGLEKQSKLSNKEDSGIVFMVGVFNLLAIVVYAAYRHVTDEPALSDRVITWQVQKVLDELVLRVHSSDYASELLSRSMPDGAVMETTRSLDKNPFKWLQVGLTKALEKGEDLKGLQKWLENLKDQLMTEVAGSDAARKSIRLNPQVYKPLKQLYAAMTKKQPDETSRAMISPWINDVGAAVVAMGQLSMEQIQGILKTLSLMRETHLEDKAVLPVLSVILNNAISENNHVSKRSVRTNQMHNSIAAALASSLTHAHAQAHNTNTRNSKNSRPVNLPVGYSTWLNENDRRVFNSKYRYPNAQPEQRMVDFKNDYIYGSQEMPVLEKNRLSASQMYQRVGKIESDTSSHWTDGWFSLVTTLAPVGLDITTLYARAKARPSCLKSLLCKANNAWKRVGAVQAAVTPFLR